MWLYAPLLLDEIMKACLTLCVADLYSEMLPSEAPPSYRGQAVKYSYKITVGMQRVNCPIKLLRLPLRVLVINGTLCGHVLSAEHSALKCAGTPLIDSMRLKTVYDVLVSRPKAKAAACLVET
jgi:hypothetical protein